MVLCRNIALSNQQPGILQCLQVYTLLRLVQAVQLAAPGTFHLELFGVFHHIKNRRFQLQQSRIKDFARKYFIAVCFNVDISTEPADQSGVF